MIELIKLRDNNGELITDYHMIRQPLPNQMNEDNSTFVSFGIVLAALIGTAAGSSILVNIFTNGSLN